MLEDVKANAESQQRLPDLQRSVFGFWKFSLIQTLPALEELLDDGAVRADDLEAGDVGSTRKNSVQAHVGKPLRAKSIITAKKKASTLPELPEFSLTAAAFENSL